MKSHLLKGNNIFLRSLNSGDFDKVLSWENNPENWRVSGTTMPFSKETITDYVNADQDIFASNQLRLIICRLDSNKVVGAVDLFDYDAFHQRAGVGILIDSAQRKKGYALEALKLIQDFSLNEIGIRNLFANILIDNAASISLFEKAGFKKIGHKKN